MALVTAQDFVTRTLRHCAQLRPGYVAGPELMADVLSEWNALWADWSLDRRMAPTVPATVYPLAGSGYLGNGRDYEIGPGAADFNGLRPIKILKANLLLDVTPTSRLPLDVLPWRDYGDISVLTVPPTTVTTSVYYEPAFPIGILHFWPPITAGPKFEFWTDGVLVPPATLATTVSFPPGYENATVFSLAEKCQYLVTKEMGKVNPKIAGWALHARQWIRNANASNPKCVTDFQSHHGRGAGGTTSGNLTLIGEL
jgi:hypothetical protein